MLIWKRHNFSEKSELPKFLLPVKSSCENYFSVVFGLEMENLQRLKQTNFLGSRFRRSISRLPRACLCSTMRLIANYGARELGTNELIRGIRAHDNTHDYFQASVFATNEAQFRIEVLENGYDRMNRHKCWKRRGSCSRPDYIVISNILIAILFFLIKNSRITFFSKKT